MSLSGSRPQPSSTVALGGRANTLGLSKRDLEELLDELDSQEEETVTQSKRKHTRRPFRQVSLSLDFVRPGGGASRVQVCTRNLSSTGMSVLHCAYQHSGTRVQIVLPGVDGKPMTVKGAVVRCIHRRANIHELGILFDKPIDTKRVIAAGLFSDWYSLEQVNPADLKGSLLYIDDSEADRRLMRKHLTDTGISIATAGSAQEGIDRAGEGFDIIVADYHLEQINGKPITEALRDSGVETTVILVSADTSAAAAQQLAKADAQAYLAKPVQQGLLLRALAEFLLVSGSGARASFASTLAPDHPNAALVESFIVDLQAFAEAIRNSMEKGDVEGCLTKLAKIKGSAAPMGFARIGDMADGVTMSLAATRRLADVAPMLSRLIAACRRASVRAA
ncbi:MAG: response regulator [Phycisphaerales bacterium]